MAIGTPVLGSADSKSFSRCLLFRFIPSRTSPCFARKCLFGSPQHPAKGKGNEWVNTSVTSDVPPAPSALSVLPPVPSPLFPPSSPFPSFCPPSCPFPSFCPPSSPFPSFCPPLLPLPLFLSSPPPPPLFLSSLLPSSSCVNYPW